MPALLMDESSCQPAWTLSLTTAAATAAGSGGRIQTAADRAVHDVTPQADTGTDVRTHSIREGGGSGQMHLSGEDIVRSAIRLR